MRLFPCRACAAREQEIARFADRERRLLDQIGALASKLTALADLRAEQVVQRGQIEQDRARERAHDRLRADAPRPVLPPDLITAERLPPAMRSVLTMGGHYRSPLAIREAREVLPTGGTPSPAQQAAHPPPAPEE